jgi:hypothetical protein
MDRVISSTLCILLTLQCGESALRPPFLACLGPSLAPFLFSKLLQRRGQCEGGLELVAGEQPTSTGPTFFSVPSHLLALTIKWGRGQGVGVGGKNTRVSHFVLRRPNHPTGPPHPHRSGCGNVVLHHSTAYRSTGWDGLFILRRRRRRRCVACFPLLLPVILCCRCA